MNKRFKRNILTVCCAAALGLCSAALVACGDDESGKQGGAKKESNLIGGFEKTEEIDAALTSDASKIGENNSRGEPYLYTSDIYPLNTIKGTDSDGVGVQYKTYQKLRLKRDYTYVYELEIMVRKIGSSNIDLVKIEATTYGTFEYTQNAGENYTVTISDPTSGSEKRYGSYIVGENNLFSWKISSSPNYSLNVQAVADGEFDRYITGRQVSVEKDGTERFLYSDVFFADMLNDVAPYCSYDASQVPDKEDPNPPAPPTPVDPVDPVEKEQDGTVLPYVAAKENAEIEYGIKADGGLSVLVSAPKSVASVTLGGASATAIEDGDKRIYQFPIEYSSLGETKIIKADDSQISFNAAEYLKGLYKSPAAPIEHAVNAFAVNILNAAQIFGADEEKTALDAAHKQYIYNAGESTYQFPNFGMRDDMTVIDTADKTEDFSWSGRVPELEIAQNGDVGLTFAFAADPALHGKISAKLKVGDGDFIDAAVKAETVSETTAYTVKAAIAAPLAYDDKITVEVYDGTVKLSTAEFSANRAFAGAYLKNDLEIKKQADALWSLGKAAVWYNDRERTAYSYDISNGRYTFKMGEHSYATPPASPDYGFLSGSRLYVGGTVINDSKTSAEGDGFMAERGAASDSVYPFTVTLDGASLDGVCVADTETKRTIEIVVKSDSVFTTMLGFNNKSGTINSDCDVLIRADAAAAEKPILTLSGGMSIGGNLTIEGVDVRVKSVSNAAHAVTCKNLNIADGGALNIEYVGSEMSDNVYGLELSGNADIDGDFTSKGFDSGICLADDDATQIFTVKGGVCNIEALRYGINMKRVSVGSYYQNRDLVFSGGVTNIKVTDGERGICGVSFADITLGNAELIVDVAHGYGIEKCDERWNGWEWNNDGKRSLPASITTTSGDYKKGKLYFTVKGSEVATLNKLDLNGGDVRFFGEVTAGSVINTAPSETDAVINVTDCDLYIENGVGTAGSGRCISFDSGNEVMTVSNSAKVTFKNCDVPISCWNVQEGKEPGKIVNDGYIVLDGYKVGLEEWQLSSWNNRLKVQNNGVIKTANFIK